MPSPCLRLCLPKGPLMPFPDALGFSHHCTCHWPPAARQRCVSTRPNRVPLSITGAHHVQTSVGTSYAPRMAQ